MSGFSRRLYALVRQIPPGQVATYGQLALLLGNPRMSRAVGTALSACRDDSIPCHRVVGTNGSLTGYAGGLDRKVKLLTLEKAEMGSLFLPKRGTAL